MSSYAMLKHFAAQPSGAGFLPADPTSQQYAAELTQAGHLEVHPTVTDMHGQRAIRVTPAGTSMLAEMAAREAAHATAAQAPAPAGQAFAGVAGVFTPPAPQAAAPAPAASQFAPRSTAFEIETGIAVPERKRGPGRGPGDGQPNALTQALLNIEVKQSLWISVTTDDPTPAKRLGPAISLMNRKYFPKQWEIHKIDQPATATAPAKQGARIWRMPDSQAAAPPPKRVRAPKVTQGAAAKPGQAPAPAPQGADPWSPPAPAAAPAPAWQPPGEGAGAPSPFPMPAPTWS